MLSQENKTNLNLKKNQQNFPSPLFERNNEYPTHKAANKREIMNKTTTPEK